MTRRTLYGTGTGSSITATGGSSTMTSTTGTPSTTTPTILRRSSNSTGTKKPRRDTSLPPPQVFTRGRTGVVKTKSGGRHPMRSRSVGTPYRGSDSRWRNSTTPVEKSPSLLDPKPLSENASSSVGASTATEQSRPREGREPAAAAAYHPYPSTPTTTRRDDASPSSMVDRQKQHVRTTRKIVDEMSRAGVPSRRIAAVTNACSLFDHFDEARHNIEIAYGAAAVLAKMIQQPVTEDEMRIICAALEMVFRASPATVMHAYQRLHTTLLPALLRCLDRCEERSVKHADISILNITKILYNLSKCTDLRVQLCRQTGLLEFVGRVAKGLNPECRSYRLMVAMNLAAEERNKVLMFEKEGLLDALLRIAHMDTFDMARQNAALVIQELATCDVLHVPLAQNDQLLGTLVKMALMEKSLQTRESVITSLQTLAFTKKNRLRLVTFKDGVVLEALRKSMAMDADDKVRRRAAGTLTNLACEETASLMGNHAGLLESLAVVATKDHNADVQARSALALTKIASHINAGMPCFKSLLDALVAASLSKCAASIMAVLRVKAREAENRRPMAHHEGVLDTLVDVCTSSPKMTTETDKDNAMRTLMHLLNDEANRTYMCTKNVLRALVRGANYEADGLTDARESAIISLERMATVVSNRAFMARYPGLLTVVATAVERESKLEDARVTCEHGYLAKPLLMTLLLSM